MEIVCNDIAIALEDFFFNEVGEGFVVIQVLASLKPIIPATSGNLGVRRFFFADALDVVAVYIYRDGTFEPPGMPGTGVSIDVEYIEPKTNRHFITEDRFPGRP